eukprot:PhM_4_TR15827/c0_g2_i1/m.96763
MHPSVSASIIITTICRFFVLGMPLGLLVAIDNSGDSSFHTSWREHLSVAVGVLVGAVVGLTVSHPTVRSRPITVCAVASTIAAVCSGVGRCALRSSNDVVSLHGVVPGFGAGLWLMSVFSLPIPLCRSGAIGTIAPICVVVAATCSCLLGCYSVSVTALILVVLVCAHVAVKDSPLSDDWGWEDAEPMLPGAVSAARKTNPDSNSTAATACLCGLSGGVVWVLLQACSVHAPSQLHTFGALTGGAFVSALVVSVAMHSSSVWPITHPATTVVMCLTLVGPAFFLVHSTSIVIVASVGLATAVWMCHVVLVAWTHNGATHRLLVLGLPPLTGCVHSVVGVVSPSDGRVATVITSSVACLGIVACAWCAEYTKRRGQQEAGTTSANIVRQEETAPKEESPLRPTAHEEPWCSPKQQSEQNNNNNNQSFDIPTGDSPQVIINFQTPERHSAAARRPRPRQHQHLSEPRHCDGSDGVQYLSVDPVSSSSRRAESAETVAATIELDPSGMRATPSGVLSPGALDSSAASPDYKSEYMPAELIPSGNRGRSFTYTSSCVTPGSSKSRVSAQTPDDHAELGCNAS